MQLVRERSDLWTDPGIKNGISVREVISTLNKKRRRGMNGRISENPRKRGKAHHYYHMTATKNQMAIFKLHEYNKIKKIDGPIDCINI